MTISTILGRPPSTSDVDCTVKYTAIEVLPEISYHMLDASVEIFMIIERIVVEVYSRKRISLRIANFVARLLKNWAAKWFRILDDAISQPYNGSNSRRVVIGSSRILSTYLYGMSD